MTVPAALRSSSAASSGGRAREVDPVHLGVCGEPRCQLGGAAGEQVGHPAGTSDVASTSPSPTAGSGRASDVTTTAVHPVASTGASTSTSPSSDDACGASTATTPVGSGADQLTKGPATGLTEPRTVAILSVQPAYQTQRSIAASTSAAPACVDTLGRHHVVDELPVPGLHHLGGPVEHLAAVVGGGARPARQAHRAALTASRTSLRDASAACASSRPRGR